jgi:hypothetical protein
MWDEANLGRRRRGWRLKKRLLPETVCRRYGASGRTRCYRAVRFGSCSGSTFVVSTIPSAVKFARTVSPM